MSRRNPDAVDRETLKVPCPYCGAAAGNWCVRLSAWAPRTYSTADLLHTYRSHAATRAGFLPLVERGE